MNTKKVSLEQDEKLKLTIERLINDEHNLSKLSKTQQERIKAENPLLDSHKVVLRDYYDTLRLGRRRLFTTNKHILKRSRKKAKSYRSFHMYIMVIVKYGKFLNKAYEDATKQDIEAYQVYLEKRNVSMRVIADYSYIIKLFYLWFFKSEGIPEIVEDIEKPKHPMRKIKPEEVIMPSEIKKLIKVADRPRDKALISLLYECQGRVGELVKMDIKDFTKFDNYAKIFLDGKTGERLLAITDSVPYIEQYLNVHMHRDDPEAPLFYSVSAQNYGKRLSAKGIAVILGQVAKKAKFKKRFNPHWFRHSGLDWLARHHHFNERDLKLRAGWSKNSNMAQVYLHYEEEEVNDMYLKQKGVKKLPEHQKEERQLVPTICPRCERENPADARYCNCGQIIDSKELMRIEKLRKESSEFSDKLMKTPVHPDVNMNKGMYEAVFENMTKNPIMMEEFKKLVNKMKSDKEV